MTTESDVKWLAGCLGMAGCANKEELRNVAEPVRGRHIFSNARDTVAQAFKQVFGEAL
jgi:hypothetical protein